MISKYSSTTRQSLVTCRTFTSRGQPVVCAFGGGRDAWGGVRCGGVHAYICFRTPSFVHYTVGVLDWSVLSFKSSDKVQVSPQLFIYFPRLVTF